ncbi:tRNA (adenosine(37)-N6)-threonylcarbamoyltransferase complex dimerization subunit type 1 TsaB [Aeromicrobium piscarium]|uniref:tRNA (Adenosine(37)-N6)-threonylcarbamoyltransferase complex dimerization subunit type 1 TsaB n=1 Tax=Aeromicrobium piscarium TaxID=2590901 RepID=A0A554SQ56_9ACTN|nr:tRNA (adenosine(37)-N6)-threonylcarbamoyltransferase complex dimerization subunit type 1 TsaB [Aeromicrobium piscarium]TSD68497.1 tRNA (adenosine(37)-N6)-threonylcarbamoyltransferase complex dimerization subunit type 1 TsaB [Aeromicrobium piscarium]
MLLLAIDTATPAITAAVHDGSRVIGEATAHGAMAHGELLASQIREALARAGAAAADLTDVAVGVGPGPYTGLRVGVVTALTLAQTLDLTPHGVCTLDILAADTDQAELIVATDARRKEVYWARYVGGVRVEGPAVDKPATVAELGLPVVGRGAEIYADVLIQSPGPLDPSAAALARLVVAGRAAELPLEPLYLRRPDATVPAARA